MLDQRGAAHVFDTGVLSGLSRAMSPEKHSVFMLPITIFFDLKTENQCYISDEAAADAVREMEGFGDVYPFRDGKMWLPNSIGMDLIRKYKGAIQQLFIP